MTRIGAVTQTKLINWNIYGILEANCIDEVYVFLF